MWYCLWDCVQGLDFGASTSILSFSFFFLGIFLFMFSIHQFLQKIRVVVDVDADGLGGVCQMERMAT